MKDEDVPAWLNEPLPEWDDVPSSEDDEEPSREPPPGWRVYTREEAPAEADDGKPDGAVWSVLAKSMRRNKDGELVEGAPKAIGLNAALVLRHDPRWAGKLAYDLHRSAVVMVDDRTRLLQPMTDADETWVQHWISSVYGMDVPQQAVGRAIDLVAREHSTHPLRDWLDGLQWDGVDRLAELWPRYFGVNADEHALVCEYGTMWAIQAVARVMRPGCDAQGMVVLVGAQGKGKTRGIQALAGDMEGRRLSVDLPTGMPLGHKDSIACMHGSWLVNVDELEALHRSSIGEIKAWVTQTEDTYRSPYGKRPESHARQQVLIGSTNRGAFLVDSTGSRRFWVMDLGDVDRVDVEAIQRDREQLWAEAVALYRSGARWWLDTAQQRTQAALNEGYRVDGWHEAEIAPYVEARKGCDRPIFVADVLEYLQDRHRLTFDAQAVMGKCKATLEHLGCRWSMRHKLPRGPANIASRYYTPPKR